MKKYLWILLLLILGTIFTHASYASSYKIIIKQRINNERGIEPIVGNNIFLYMVEGDKNILIDISKTNKDGRAIFHNLKRGKYILRDDKKMDYSIGEVEVNLYDSDKELNLKSTKPIDEDKNNRKIILKNKINKEKYKKTKTNLLIPRTGQIEIFVYTIGGLLIFLIGFFVYRKCYV